MNKIISLLSILFLGAIVTFVSCKKETEGCTDPTADNYNPEATINADCKYSGCTDKDAENYNPQANVSTDCTYARDKFIGAYTGQLACPTLSVISGATNFTIDENIAGGKNDVTIVITTNSGVIVPITGTCVGNDVTINTTIKQQEIELPVLGKIKVDITATGSATYDAATKKLEGPLTIRVVNETLFIDLSDTCNFTGTKK